ncbi:MAG TPA: hypothetical protein VN541_19355, partial [Tepidisphaeraceae bacterium]|nr:hypothetical protein [Tepidisphaeraceae bacterium]
SGNYFAVFTNKGDSGELYARTNVDGATVSVDLGAMPSGYHVYAIKPVSGAFDFFIDGTLVATLSAAFPGGTQLNVVLSNPHSSPMTAQWVRLSSYVSSGTFLSQVFDAGQTANWGTMSWTDTLPAGTSIVIETRSGNSPTPDSTWSAWAPVPNGGTVSSPASRYIQYEVTLTTTNPLQTPTLSGTSLQWS